jgi:hypothetical protein
MTSATTRRRRAAARASAAAATIAVFAVLLAGEGARAQLIPSKDTPGYQLPLLADLSVATRPYDTEPPATCPDGTEMDPTDCNHGAGGDEIYICRKRKEFAKMTKLPIDDVLVHATHIREWTCPANYEPVSLAQQPGALYNLNASVGGKYVFVCVHRAVNKVQLVASDVKVSLRRPCSKPWEDASSGGHHRVNLNAGANGDELFLCVLPVPDPR